MPPISLHASPTGSSPAENPTRESPKEEGSGRGLIPPSHHTHFEDAQGLIIGSLLVALGLTLFGNCNLLTGGTAGIAFLLHYTTHLPFGWLFFLVNLPFYWLAVRRIGWEFTIKTFISVTLLSVLTDLAPHFLQLAWVSPLYSAVTGGLLMGVGVLMFIRHHSSLGGVNILAVYLQQVRGWRAGKIQMTLDVLVVITSFFVVSPSQVFYSIIGAVALGFVLSVNHKPGRYTA